MEQSNTIRRIEEMEAILDRGTAAVRQLYEALGDFEAVLPSLARLENYYLSPAWREDYEADERGALPPALKRGVLSQDAVYDLLAQRDALLAAVNRK